MKSRRELLAQIREAKRVMRRLPKWMRAIAYFACTKKSL
jgi:hypothetical protein